MAFAGLEQIRHLVPATPQELQVGPVTNQELQVGPVTNQEQARDVWREAGLVEIDPDGVGPVQFRDAAAGHRERPHRAGTKPERIPFEVIVVKDRPRPSDDGVGVDVRCVVEVVVIDQPVTQIDDRVEVVDAERVGRPHRRTNATMRRPWSIAARAAASSRSMQMSFCRCVGTSTMLFSPRPSQPAMFRRQ